MSKTTPIYTADAPAPVGPYSQAMRRGDWLFCSGQVPIDPKTNEVFRGPIQKQAELVLKNIEALLVSQDMDFTNVIKTTIFLTDMKDFAAVNEVYAKYFGDHKPARSTVAVAGLPKEVNVEIEVIAHE